jgi:hypothetical protein
VASKKVEEAQRERERESAEEREQEKESLVLFASWWPRFTAEHVSLRPSERRMTEGARKTASNCSYPPADIQLAPYKWTALIPFCRGQRAPAPVYPVIVADDLRYVARILPRAITDSRRLTCKLHTFASHRCRAL